MLDNYCSNYPTHYIVTWKTRDIIARKRFQDSWAAGQLIENVLGDEARMYREKERYALSEIHNPNNKTYFDCRSDMFKYIEKNHETEDVRVETFMVLERVTNKGETLPEKA